MCSLQTLLTVGERRKAHYCIARWPHVIVEQTYEVFLLALILLAPVAIMSVADSRICVELWKVKRCQQVDLQQNAR